MTEIYSRFKDAFTFIPEPKQYQLTYCGPSSLIHVAQYFHLPVSRAQIEADCEFTPELGTDKLPQGLARMGLYPLEVTGLDFEVLDTLVGQTGVAVLNYMDRGVGTPADLDIPRPPDGLDGTYDPNDWGHYAVYLGRTGPPQSAEKRIHLLCPYRGKYWEPEWLFHTYWWDMGEKENTFSYYYAVIAYGSKAHLSSAQKILQTLETS